MRLMFFTFLFVLGMPAFAVTGTIPADEVIPEIEVQKVDSGKVSRSHFTSGIKNHEPLDNLLSLSNQQNIVYYFSELLDLKGKTITHRWEYDGKVIADVTFKVGGNRWRVWSKKTIFSNWTGEWKVSILNQQGKMLTSNTLNYTEVNQR